jgi:RimJ/RimL family protein N-acetyltransferase
MLKGKNCFLRVLEEEDLDRTHQWLNTIEIMEAISINLPTSKMKQKKWFERLISDNTKVVFAICLNDSGEHIGNVSLSEIDFINRNARFSIFIHSGKARGKGIGTEATNLTLQYGFNYLNLHKIYLKTTSDNIGAMKMYENIGFIQEGILKEHEFKNGKYVDKILYGIIVNDFNYEL